MCSNPAHCPLTHPCLFNTVLSLQLKLNNYERSGTAPQLKIPSIPSFKKGNGHRKVQEIAYTLSGQTPKRKQIIFFCKDIKCVVKAK
jgi:hypothetical protein